MIKIILKIIKENINNKEKDNFILFIHLLVIKFLLNIDFNFKSIKNKASTISPVITRKNNILKSNIKEITIPTKKTGINNNGLERIINGENIKRPFNIGIEAPIIKQQKIKIEANLTPFFKKTKILFPHFGNISSLPIILLCE